MGTINAQLFSVPFLRQAPLPINILYFDDILNAKSLPKFVQYENVATYNLLNQNMNIRVAHFNQQMLKERL